MNKESQSTLESSSTDYSQNQDDQEKISYVELQIVRMLEYQGIEYFEPNVILMLISYIKTKARKYLNFCSEDKVSAQDVKLSILADEYTLNSPPVFYKTSFDRINEDNKYFEEKALNKERIIKELNSRQIPKFKNLNSFEFYDYKPINNGTLLEPNFL